MYRRKGGAEGIEKNCMRRRVRGGRRTPPGPRKFQRSPMYMRKERPLEQGNEKTCTGCELTVVDAPSPSTGGEIAVNWEPPRSGHMLLLTASVAWFESHLLSPSRPA